MTTHDFRYFLTIVDDYSCFTWVYFLKTKNDVSQHFPHFNSLVQTQFNTKIKSVRSDNAHELAFTNFFFHEKGIIAFHSCVNIPEQNSIVERKHQHILNVAKALYFQSNVPFVYWDDCVLTFVFLINQTPSALLSNKTPLEIL